MGFEILKIFFKKILDLVECKFIIYITSKTKKSIAAAIAANKSFKKGRRNKQFAKFLRGTSKKAK